MPAFIRTPAQQSTLLSSTAPIADTCNSSHRYRIQWKDPITGEYQETIKEFNDTETVSAKEWAEDWAYMAADKGHAIITEVK